MTTHEKVLQEEAIEGAFEFTNDGSFFVVNLLHNYLLFGDEWRFRPRLLFK